MILTFSNVSKNFGVKPALSKVSFSLSEGIYGLLGPNGAGKSTLMNILVGNLAPSSGEVTCDGVNIRTMGADFRKILGYMPQQQSLYPNFTVLRFMHYMATLRELNKASAKAKISWALQRVGLEAYGGQRIHTLSGGMKQRLLIAQAIIADPSILVLDEPTAGLDPQQRIEVRNLISEIALHKIVLIATHVVPDIENIAKEIILIQGGSVIAQAPPLEFCQSIDGKVYEVLVEEKDLTALQQTFQVVQITPVKAGKILVRIIASQPPSDYISSRQVFPTLEEVYLHLTKQ